MALLGEAPAVAVGSNGAVSVCRFDASTPVVLVGC